MEIRTDRVGLLIDQLEESLQISRDRVADMSDDEYLWEPVPDMWSLRRTACRHDLDALWAGRMETRLRADRSFRTRASDHDLLATQPSPVRHRWSLGVDLRVALD